MFEDEFRQKKYIIIYIFHGYPVEAPAHIPQGKSKGKFRRRFRKAAIYIANTSEPALPIKYSEYTDIFFKDEINSISSVTRINHAINFEENSIILYKSIYYFSERELIILKQYLIESEEKN
jgi:hypothetical protein